ncbi:MAG: tail fiber domain-containing protein, partial [Parcubacteria group bacterium]|nr:tail fiber domain-containing protein [Parcubacteria group bacterium]
FTTGLISEASTTISSTLHVSDNFSASSTSLFAGLSLFESGFITQASSTIGGPFYVLDNLSASSTLTVASLATFDSGFISSASSSVSAPLHVSDIIAGSSTLAIDQSAYFALQSGSVGIASSTPWGQFSVEKITTGAPTFVVSDQGSTTPWFTVNEDGNIGIGATSSSQRVNIDGDNPYIAIFDSTSGAEVLIGSDLSRLQLWVDGSEKASLTSGGNFGIGTTSPWGLLSVEQQSGEPVFVVADNGTSTPHLLVDGMGRVGVGSSSPWGALSVHSFLGTGEAYNDENLAAAFVVGSTTAGGVNDTQFVVQRSGSVGIGTTSPQEKLTVINKVHAASIPPNYLASITNANNATDNYGLIVGTNWANTENFVANFGKYAGDTGIYTSYFVVKGDGNVGIGDDTPTNAKLEVNQTGDNLWQTYFLNSAGTDPFGVHIVFTVTKDDNSHKFLEAQDGTTNRAILYSDGDWYNHDGTYGIISDKRLKSNIEDTGNQVDKISQIKVRDYLKYDTKEKKGLGKNETGFVAQELELIYPELVSEIVWNDKETIKAVNTTGLIPYLTRAIQELASSASLQQAEILASKSAISNFQFLISNDAEVSATSSIYIASDGSVGIGSVFSSTTPPSHTLTVDGEVGAYGFVNISARDAKKDIQKISNSQFPISNSPDENPNSRFQILHSPTATPLEKILSTSIYTYRYIGDKTEETRLGLIAEEAPKEVLSLDDKGVDLYKLASFTLAGVQVSHF